MKKIYNNLGLILLCVLLLLSCDYKPTAAGDDRQIFVFADSLLWNDIKEDVGNTFFNYIYTPRAEKSFILTYRSAEKLNDLKVRRNLMFIGTLDGNSPIDKYIQGIIPIEFSESVQKGTGFYFFKNDLFLGDQITIFMVANSKEQFLESFYDKKLDIFNNFNQRYLNRLKKRIYNQGEQTDLEEYLVNNFGYKIRIQHDYFLANQEPSKKYIWLRRLKPDRWISIWRENADIVDFTEESLFDLRNKMARKYYGGDVIVEEETAISKQKFIGIETIKITGTWRNDSLIIGGPFRTYLVPNEKENAIYFVDIAVMAPTRDKKPYLDQLEVIASTFSFENKK